MYFGVFLFLWNFLDALAIPVSGLNNDNKYYNPNHQYNISWDYDHLVSHIVIVFFKYFKLCIKLNNI